MGGEGPSPKRRRIDDGPMSAADIAQANSTLQVFTGQRHNRWMQGWTPLNAANAQDTQTSSAQTRAVNDSRQKELENSTVSRSRRDVGARGSHFPVVNLSAGEPAERVNPRSDVVQYQSPQASGTAVSTMKTPSLPTPLAVPGLPSPALSEENTSSPIIGRPNPHRLSVGSNDPTRKRGPGRPPKYNPSATQAATSPVAPANSHAHLPHGPTARSASTPGIHMSRHGSRSSLHQPTPSERAEAAISTQRLVQTNQQSLVPTDYPLTTNAMLNRFDLYKGWATVHLQLTQIDNGRLTLLRDAIERNDMFYIVLNQIQALRQWPAGMPVSAQSISPESFTYLDNLLCPNPQINADLLSWLAGFPTPIHNIYSSQHMAAVYEPIIANVAQFLRLMPRGWDVLVQKSKERHAPPLVQEMYDSLHLQSVVLQTTVFRAIARTVVSLQPTIDAEPALDRLEKLHKLDQQEFFQGYRRTAAQTGIAHAAFAKVQSVSTWEQLAPVFQRSGQPQHPPPSTPAIPSTHALAHWNGTNLPRQRAGPQAQQPQPNHAPHNNNNGLPPHLQQQYAEAYHNRALTQMMLAASNAMEPRPPHVSAQTPILRSNTTTPHQLPNGSVFMFPRENDQPRPQPVNPDPTRSALHQAHLRSPTFVRAELQSDDECLYRYVAGFALSPTEIDKDTPLQNIEFSVPEEHFDKMPATRPSETPGEPPTRALDETSQMYRLRCAALINGGFPDEGTWMVADNFWPEQLFLEFNDAHLEPRRKLHHGRYLPIDLTDLIKAGDNTIKVVVNRTSTDPRPFSYVLSVEVVAVMSHTSIKTQLRTISAEETLIAIKKSLQSNSNDEEISVTSSNLTIKLVDPYSGSKMFDLPVRGSACAHKDCFDLETFLSLCKRQEPGWPTVVDCWRCPLCRGDVRPQTLVIDGFLVQVRSELENKGLLSTRAIVVEGDGSWKPKAEERTGVRSPSLDREDRAASAMSGTGKKVTEIIEID